LSWSTRFSRRPGSRRYSVLKFNRGRDIPGYNVGVNIGAAAGQTIAHAHVHLVPRYRGDVADPRGGVRWIIPAKAAYWDDAR